jgi:hypothetical protein
MLVAGDARVEQGMMYLVKLAAWSLLVSGQQLLELKY